ncbi:MAG: hypothetical protein QOK16_4741 [Solirubrobacteraceae bacterium]|nr:hypothetical protein [Solirubrobacteraceae bacterium]
MLLLKLALAPALVVGATVAGRHWGSRASGILIALPLVAGPILLVITLQHGEAFGARAARGSLLGVLALSAFCVVFARMTRLGWAWALAVGWLTYAAVAAAASRWDPPPLAGLAVALAAVAIARTLLGADDGARATTRSPPPWDLYARAASTAVLVITITTAAGRLGPALSGVLTPFPIATSVLAAFTLAHDGASAARAMLRGFVGALPAFAAFFFAVAVTLT